MLSIFKRSNQTSERQLRKYRKIVQQINKLEATYEAMSDEQLTNMTDTFKERDPIWRNNSIHYSRRFCCCS